MHLNGIEIKQVSKKNNSLVVWNCQASYIRGGVVFERNYVRYTAEGYEGGTPHLFRTNLSTQTGLKFDETVLLVTKIEGS